MCIEQQRLCAVKLWEGVSITQEATGGTKVRHPIADVQGKPPVHAAASLAELCEALKTARARNDLEEMICIAKRLRDVFPTAVDGYHIGALALRQSGRQDEAATVLREAESNTRETLWLRAEWAELARQRGDWADVAEQARILRERFPSQTAGWRLGYSACRNLGDLDRGAVLLQEVLPRAQGEEWAVEAALMVAAHRGDWRHSCGCAETLRSTFPANEHGYRLGLRSLRLLKRFDEMATLIAFSKEMFPGRDWVLSESAHVAQARSDWSEASLLWQQVRSLSANLPDGYIGGIRASLQLGQLAEAGVLAWQAASRFPEAAWLMAEQADIACAHGNVTEAAQLCENLRRAHPDAREGYQRGYRYLRLLGRLNDAETVLEQALARFGPDRWALTEFALVAKAKHDFSEAERRWHMAAEALPNDEEIALRYAMVRAQDVPVDNRDWATTRARLVVLNARFPNYVRGWLEHVKTLRLMGASAEAENLARDCLRVMQDEPQLWLEYADATNDDTGQTTLERLRQAARLMPQDRLVQTALAEALGRVGLIEEAEDQYGQVLHRMGLAADLLCGLAALAMRRQDWPVALERWRAAQAHYPNDSRVASGLLDSLAAIEEAHDAAAQPQAAPMLDIRSEPESLLAHFESLGGTGQACEFGIVQRAGGVEPLGLLRWMHITPAALTTGLLDRFEGVGTPEQTVVDYYRGEDPENPEYRYRDTRLDTRMHTFVRKKQVPEADMFKQTCRRVSFLRRKLIQDLGEARKIFVYKIFERTMDASEIAALHEAMRSYGETTLLYVCYADATHQSGTVERAGRGLLIGYISGFNICRQTQALRAPDLPAWNAICQTAFDLQKSCLG